MKSNHYSVNLTCKYTRTLTFPKECIQSMIFGYTRFMNCKCCKILMKQCLRTLFITSHPKYILDLFTLLNIAFLIYCIKLSFVLIHRLTSCILYLPLTYLKAQWGWGSLGALKFNTMPIICYIYVYIAYKNMLYV